MDAVSGRREAPAPSPVVGETSLKQRPGDGHAIITGAKGSVGTYQSGPDGGVTSGFWAKGLLDVW